MTNWGECYDWYPRKIKISADLLKQNDFFTIEKVIFHELGHCVLGRDHTNEESIMMRGWRPSDSDVINRKLYFDELFLYKSIEHSQFVQHCSKAGEWIQVQNSNAYFLKQLLSDIMEELPLYRFNGKKALLRKRFEKLTQTECWEYSFSL